MASAYMPVKVVAMVVSVVVTNDYYGDDELVDTYAGWLGAALEDRDGIGPVAIDGHVVSVSVEPER